MEQSYSNTDSFISVLNEVGKRHVPAARTSIKKIDTLFTEG